jgi:uncharacterized protein YgfB (UPF0149 family)
MNTHCEAKIDRLSSKTHTKDRITQCNHYLKHSPLAASFVEAYGIYCGLWCGTPDQPIMQTWLAELFPDVLPDQVGLITETLRELTAQLENAVYAEHELIPIPWSADADLATRVNALHDWVRGLLYGLVISPAWQHIATETTIQQEIIPTLIEITHLDLSAVQNTKEQDDSFMIVYRFVSMALCQLAAYRVERTL